MFSLSQGVHWLFSNFLRMLWCQVADPFHEQWWSWWHHWKMLNTSHHRMITCIKKQKLSFVPLNSCLLHSGFLITQLESTGLAALSTASHLSLHFESWCLQEKTISSDKMIDEQAAEVAWRQFRNKEAGGNTDNTLKLQSGRTEDGGNVMKPSLLVVASDQCNVDWSLWIIYLLFCDFPN